MDLPDNRGAHFTKMRDENRIAVWRFYEENPKAMQKEAADALGLHLNTISAHCKAIRAGWRPQQ